MTKRVAVLAPVAWRTPPQQYGAWETVASNITEGLVARGWDVTLFASRDSRTRARLHAVIDRGYEEDSSVDPKVAEYLHISEAQPDKGVHLAIEVALMSGLPLLIAGIVQDEEYFRGQVQPHIDNKQIRYIGPVDVEGKNELFARARALLHLKTIPERFGLSLRKPMPRSAPLRALFRRSFR